MKWHMDFHLQQVLSFKSLTVCVTVKTPGVRMCKNKKTKTRIIFPKIKKFITICSLEGVEGKDLKDLSA